MRVSTRPGSSVRALLADRKVKLGAEDTVSPAVTTALRAGLRIKVTQVRYRQAAEDQRIEQPAGQRVEDAGLLIGTEQVVQQGHAGVVRVVYRYRVVNEKDDSRAEVGRNVLQNPAPTITHIGTRTPPVETAQPPPDPTTPVAEPTPTPQPEPDPTTPVAEPTPTPQPEPTPKPDPTTTQAPPAPPTYSGSISCPQAASVTIVVSGSGPVKLSMSPGGSHSGSGSTSGTGTLSGGGSVSFTWSGDSYSWSAVGAQCNE
ncbi:MAG: G5 domain-containing protein [Nakamurella sp.]